jgi:hypothetical protein
MCSNWLETKCLGYIKDLDPFLHNIAKKIVQGEPKPINGTSSFCCCLVGLWHQKRNLKFREQILYLHLLNCRSVGIIGPILSFNSKFPLLEEQLNIKNKIAASG